MSRRTTWVSSCIGPTLSRVAAADSVEISLGLTQSVRRTTQTVQAKPTGRRSRYYRPQIKVPEKQAQNFPPCDEASRCDDGLSRPHVPHGVPRLGASATGSVGICRRLCLADGRYDRRERTDRPQPRYVDS